MRSLEDDARRIFDASVQSVRPDVVLPEVDLERCIRRPLGAYRAVWMIGIGKASLAMGAVLEKQLDCRIDGGYIATARGYTANLPSEYVHPTRVEVGEGGHPYPDEGSVRSARRVLEVARRAGADDLVIVLVSGGGSSVCTDFFGDISIDDARETFKRLMDAGLDIYAVNAVRKQMSRIAGGRLARAIQPAEGIALIVSDVVGDDPAVIASGPTVPDTAAPQEAVEVLKEANIWDAVPPSVRSLLEQRIDGRVLQDDVRDAGPQMLEGAPRFRNEIIATNGTAIEGAAAAAARLGYEVDVIERELTGEAREVGPQLVRRLMSDESANRRCYIAGGETSVTVRGRGRGGRNQELALAAAIALSRQTRGAAVLSGGTDGVDGPTDAAGAVVTHATVDGAREMGLNPHTFLEENDSYAFFEQVGGLIVTGPTHTNVMDVAVMIA